MEFADCGGEESDFGVGLSPLGGNKFISDFLDGHNADDQKQSTADMTAFVQTLLQQMQSRFQAMSESIISKIDDMGSKIDELEQNINELRAEMGIESSPPPVLSKPKIEPKQEMIQLNCCKIGTVKHFLLVHALLLC